MPRTHVWNRLEGLKVPLKLRASTIRLYKNVITKFAKTKDWSEKITYNIGVKKSYPLFPTIFGTHNDKLESYLEEVGHVSMTLDGIVVILLIYDDDIVLLVRCPFDLIKKLIILNDLCLSTSTTINTDKTKVT